MKKDWILCNTCGVDDYQVMAYIGGWPVGKCAQCGQVYVNPIPVFDAGGEFSQLSREVQSSEDAHGETTPQILRHDEIQLKQHLAEIRRLTDHGWAEVRFLDVGCGSGAAVKAAAQLGWAATGLDIDGQLIAAGQRQSGVDLRCTTLLDARLPDDHFHFIRMRDVIEHLPNPYEALLEIRRMLVPGGVLLLATPNEDGLPTQVRLWLGRRPTRVATGPPPHHLHGFTPETLSRILVRTGYNLMEVKTTTPVDPTYMTSSNMRSRRNLVYSLVWESARMIGRGSMVVAWAQK